MDGGNARADNETAAFQDVIECVRQSRAACVIHTHAASRTMADAANLSFDLTRIVKTVAFRARSGAIVLAALRGTRRVDYPKLAALIGLKRRDLAPLSAAEVKQLLGVEPGGVSPLPPREDVAIFIDNDALTIRPTIFCGAGRQDKTLEIAPEDLVRLARARTGDFSRSSETGLG
ncbi:MAG: YbaK/EbsC family protein [Desulfovibrionaceae bacterium]|nr:YbaK/EbsC family protein [Desulfovibrionaceae bacterium]MBF0512931.1 YbaK/EbsC family protein [Desulfovibrionaceae bacterium]